MVVDDEVRRERDPRVVLAAERTLLAWVRTGLALMGFGFVVARFGLFLREIAASKGVAPVQHLGASQWVGTLMVILGVCVNLLAAAQHVRFVKRYNRGVELRPATVSTGVILSVILALVGIAMAGYLTIMR